MLAAMSGRQDPRMASAEVAAAGPAIGSSLAPESRHSFPVYVGPVVRPHGLSGEGKIDQGRGLSGVAACSIRPEELSVGRRVRQKDGGG